MITIANYYDTNNATLYSSTAIGRGQVFLVGNNDYNIKQAKFYLYKTGSPTGNAVVKIYATTGTGANKYPTGSVLATSDNLDVSTLTTSKTEKTFTFSGVNQIKLVKNTYYCATVEYSGSDVSNYIWIGTDNSGSYASGNAYGYDTSAGYTTLSNYDQVFAIEGDLYTGIEANGSVISSSVIWKSLKITDTINEKVNTCDFSVYDVSGRYDPTLNHDVKVFVEGTQVFGGSIFSVEKINKGGVLIENKVKCWDYTKGLERYIVAERFTNQTVAQIITSLLATYDEEDEYTTTNVDCDVLISSISFINIPLNQAIQKLAQQVNYFWYVDYDKDIHFFAKGDNLSPFNLTDSSDNFIFNSLSVRDDLMQLKNRIKIRGGEIVSPSRSQVFDGDGTKDVFVLGYKFSTTPTVVVNSVSKTVGIDNVSQEADYDCFWNANEKYIKFKSTTIPASGTNNIVVTGTPLIPIQVQVEDFDSINSNGVWEYYKEDKNIKSQDEANQYANAQLEQFKSEINDGGFKTKDNGLRSGQVININSTIYGINKDYQIQSVKMSAYTPTEFVYDIDIASYAKINVIDILQKLLLNENGALPDKDTETLYKYFNRTDNFGVSEGYYQRTGASYHYVLGDHFPTNPLDPSLTDNKRNMQCDRTAKCL